MTNKEKLIQLEKELHNECAKLTRKDIYPFIEHEWEKLMPNLYNSLGFDRGETLYLDNIIEQWIEARWDTPKELTEEDQIKLYEWALNPKTEKACNYEW